MCLDCYPDRCFTCACKNASHCTAVSVPACCCTVRRDFRSNRAFCPVFTVILCSSLEARRCFPCSCSLSSLSATHHPAHASSRRITGEQCLCSTPPPTSISSLSPSHCMGDDNTPILPWPSPRAFFAFPLPIFSISPSFAPFPPLFHYNLSLSSSQERSALYCTLLWHWKLHSLDLY